MTLHNTSHSNCLTRLCITSTFKLFIQVLEKLVLYLFPYVL